MTMDAIDAAKKLRSRALWKDVDQLVGVALEDDYELGANVRDVIQIVCEAAAKALDSGS